MSSINEAKRGPSSPLEPITLSSDSDSELAITHHSVKRPKKEALISPVKPELSISPTPVASSSRLPSRAELEAERLARQQARQADPTEPTPSYTVRPASKSTNFGSFRDLASDSSAPVSSGLGSGKGKGVATLASLPDTAASTTTTNYDHRFWQGAIKRVPNRYRADSSSYSIADLVGPTTRTDIIKAIASTFASDLRYLLPHFHPNTDLTLVLPSADKNCPAMPPRPVAPEYPRTVVVSPAMHGFYGSAHVKVIVVFHKSYCRVVIPTANLIEYDWAEMDNALYVHDFPRLPAYHSKNPLENPTHTSFSRPLVNLLIKLGVPNKATGPFRDYDFSSSAGVAAIPSCQGIAEGWQEMNDAGGLVGLANAVKALGVEAGGKWRVEATGSSIGNYKPNWLSQMLGACAGLPPAEWGYSKQRQRPPGQAFNVPTREAANNSTDLSLKIIFHTQDYVLNSPRGADHGGTLFCQPKHWNDPAFPRHLFHQGRSKRSGIPAHTKQIIALHAPAAPGGKHRGYVVQGSHNFTAAAWGSLQHPRGPQTSMYNWELSVLIPFEADTEAELEAKASELAMYERPLVKYGPGDVAWQQSLFLKDG